MMRGCFKEGVEGSLILRLVCLFSLKSKKISHNYRANDCSVGGRGE